MENQDENTTLSFERVLFFSDAVFAIVITLLVLEIKVPHIAGHTEAAFKSELLHLLPKVLGFICSFFVVGMLWYEHHRIFRYINHFTAGLIWRNLVFLLFISFIPFPTALFSEYPWSRTALLIYIALFGLAALAKLWVWTYAVRARLLPETFGRLQALKITRRSLCVPLGCLVCVILSLFVPTYFAFVGFALIPVFARLLDPTARSKDTRSEEPPDSAR